MPKYLLKWFTRSNVVGVQEYVKSSSAQLIEKLYGNFTRIRPAIANEYTPLLSQ